MQSLCYFFHRQERLARIPWIDRLVKEKVCIIMVEGEGGCLGPGDKGGMESGGLTEWD